MQRTEKIYRLRILPLLAGATLLLAVSGNLLAGAEGASTSALLPSSPVTRARVNATLASGPLRFEENLGQVLGPAARDVRFVSRGSAYTLFLTSTEAVLVLRQHVEGKDTGKAPPVVVLRMHLSGGNQILALMGQDKLPGISNYFLGNDPSQWHTGIANFTRVSAKDVYPGIDLVYHGNQGQLEYDFEVAPGADAGRIRLALEGARQLRIDSEGDLIVKVVGGELRFRRPVAYQKVDGAKHFVPVRYALKGKNQVEFHLASYNHRQPLVIDPILAYSTYVGGSDIDFANGIAVALDGTAFIAGGTFSSDFPTVNALFPTYTTVEEAFVSKLSADGTTLLYSTYLGGSAPTVASAIALDSAGEAYVTGTTNATDFPVTADAFDLLCGADGKCGASWNTQGYTVPNAFVTKLNISGTGLVYSSYLGTYAEVEGLGIAVDANEDAYVAGAVGPNITPTVTITPPATPPPPFCTTNGFQTTFGGSGTDGFIVKIDATASQLLYCSYLGGSDEDVAFGVAVDTTAHAYVTGLTYSSNFPTTDNATYTSTLAPLQGTYEGAGDAFLSKVNTNGSGETSLLYSTYLGGSGIDQGNAVAVDSSGNAYVTGLTTSLSGTLGFTPPAGAYQPQCALDSTGNCEGDVFVAKLNPTLSGAPSLTYFTYLGGAFADSGTGIAVDASGDAYLTGWTASTNFPIVSAVFQPTYGGGNADAFVAELNPGATALLYSSYLGGSSTDTASGIGIDTSGSAYVAGETCSLDFPLVGPEQPSYGGNCDAFMSKVIQSGGVSLSPAGLVFGSYDVGQQSPPQTITLTNGASVVLTINSITRGGDDPSDFSQTNTCGTSVAAVSSCTITVTFTPTSVTPPSRTATLTINDTLTGGTPQNQVADLSGTAGTAPVVSLSPTSIAFSTTQAVGVTSAPQTLTVTNTGAAALTISNFAVSGGFAIQSNNCTVSLQPTTNCTILLTFTPVVAGPSVGALTLTDNAPNTPQVILLTGTGVNLPSVLLSSSSLNFGSIALGTSSAAQTVTVTNTGTANLTVTSIAAPAPFAEADTCSLPVAPQGICTISVTFTPTAAGGALGSVTITDNAPNSPQVISLTGTGVTAPIATLAPTSVTFATAQAVGTTSASQTVTLTNSGTASLTISALATTGQFGIAAAGTSCSTALPVAVSGTCTIAVNFTPTTTGNLYGALTVTDNSNGTTSTQVTALSGTGTGTPVVSLSSSTLAFSTTQPVGVTTAPLPLTVTNTGTAALTITAVTASGDFAVATDNCLGTLQATTPASNCTITVTFTPTVAGQRVGALTLTDNAADSPQVVVLTGTGIAQPVVGLSATSLSFGNQVVSTTSLPQTLTVSNTGTATLTFTSVTTSGPFAVSTNTCGASLAVGSTCAITVTFTPTTNGAAVGTLTLTDNAANSPQTVSLTGTGISAPSASLSPLSLTFPTEPLGTTSAAQTVTLSNSGNATLLITGITASTNFELTTTCGASVPVGASCNISVTFTPTTVGNIFGTLTVTDNSNGVTGSTQTVALEGTGLGGPEATLSASSLTFGSQPLGTTSPLQSLTLTNSGTATMTSIIITISGDFAETNTCGTALAAGNACTINVTFTPTALGTRTGALTISDSAPNSPQIVALTGGGADFTISINPTSATVVAGNSATTVVSVGSVGGFNSAVTISCSGLPTLAACTASPATVTPVSTGPVTSTLTLSTARRTSSPPGGLPQPPGPSWMMRPGMWLLGALLLLAWGGCAARKNRRRWSWAAFAVAALWLATLAACGAGGNGYVNPTGTPAGTYTVTIIGTSGALTHSASFTLTVQ